MQIIIFTKEDTVSFDLHVTNLVQLYDYLRVNRPELYNYVRENELCYTVYDENKEKAYPILHSMLEFDISNFRYLVLCPSINGEALFSAIATGVTAAVGSSFIGYTVATVVSVGLIIGLGMLIRSLTPQNKLDNTQDPAEVSKIYNGVPNITEQGGSVPVVFGNCLYGGVRIGLKFEVALEKYNDVVPVPNFQSISGLPSTWLKIV